MGRLLNTIRMPGRRVPFGRAVLHTALVACAGVAFGVIAKVLDQYATIFGDIFSQMSVWIFLCTAIAVYSSTPLRAAVNVFFFCIGMVAAYYLTAEWIGGVYSLQFVYGWTVFTFLTPVQAFGAWYAKGKRLISKIIGAGIILVMLAAAIILFDKIRLSDILFAVATGVVLMV